MNDFTPYSALIGGGLIGLAASGLVLLAGRIAGVSGIAAGVLSARGHERLWRAAFVLGLVAGAAAIVYLSGIKVEVRSIATVPGLILAGLLVGFGSRLGSGCTSGHGICGIARLSPRSLVAVGVFMATAAIVVFLVRHVMGVPTWP
jgi:uncharacterized membrane protein YedE/YeeE